MRKAGTLESQVRAESLAGFAVWRGTVPLMRGSHLHADIEMNLVLGGEIEYFLAGRFHTLRSGELVAFWAGMPHAVTRVAPETETVWVVIPLSWFLEWNLPAHFRDDLLRGQMIRAPREAREYSRAKKSSRDEAPCGQAMMRRAQFLRWCDEMPQPVPGKTGASPNRASPDGAARKIVALEVEACLRRLVSNYATRRQAKGAARVLAGRGGRGADAQIEKLAAWMGAHYREEIGVEEIARAANLNPNYAMTLFREKCGLGLWEYVVRLRVSHAQHLLLSSDRKMDDIARASGFGSVGRFYAAFSRYAGTSPRAWRQKHR